MKVASPCIGICSIDYDAGVCIGCLRKMDEISNWASYTSDKRRGIMQEIETSRVPKYAQLRSNFIQSRLLLNQTKFSLDKGIKWL